MSIVIIILSLILLLVFIVGVGTRLSEPEYIDEEEMRRVGAR